MILVTGANGFVGSALAARLARDGRAVLGGVRDVRAVLPPDVRPVLLGDLAQTTNHGAALAGVRCVVHAAARVHVLDEKARDPLTEFRRVNVDGTLALARQAADAGVRRFVFVSSIKVNGEATMPGTAFHAEDPPRPLDAYGVSKCEAEVKLREFAQTGAIEVSIVRPPLVYGPGVRANFRALMRALHSGWPLPFGAVDNRRSLVGIENLVDLLAVCTDAPSAANRTFLVSDDEDVSTTALLRRLAKALGVRPRLIPIPSQLLTGAAAVFGLSARMRRLCENLQVDISTTRNLLGWQPRHSLDEGLSMTAEDFLHEARI